MKVRQLILICAGSLCLLPAVATAQQPQEPAARRILWQAEPIVIELVVGEERLVHFPGPVSVGIPANIEPSLRTQTVNGTVYWLAYAPFASTRIAVRELDSGRVYLLDLEAGRDNGDNAAIWIIPGRASGEVVATQPGVHDLDYVALTRFAAQQLYAPARLLKPLPGLVRVPVQSDPVALVPGATIKAEPMLSWRAGSTYITAVKLTNLTHTPQLLDPRVLRGEWLAATFQHARLLPRNSDAATTVLYLVSALPFDQAGRR